MSYEMPCRATPPHNPFCYEAGRCIVCEQHKKQDSNLTYRGIGQAARKTSFRLENPTERKRRQGK